MACLVDTNILVYRCDPRDPPKRAAATEVLRLGAASGEFHICYQSLVEFVHVVTHVRTGYPALMSTQDAARQAEYFIAQFPVLYPTEEQFRMTLYGTNTYRLSWFDACIWAYAEHHGMTEIVSEDFEHGRRYGSVRVRNPFLAYGLS